MPAFFLLSPCQYVSGMADDATGRDSDKFMLRLPNGMRDRLKAEAEANKRSMNAEIVARLESTLSDASVASKKVTEEAVDVATLTVLQVLLMVANSSETNIKEIMKTLADATAKKLAKNNPNNDYALRVLDELGKKIPGT